MDVEPHPQIKRALGLGAVSTVHSQWSAHREAQVDLVIDRADQCINLCEIKFCDGEFRVTAEYAKRLERKKQLFLERTKTRKALFTTLITPYGTHEDKHFLSVVDNQLTMEALFND